MAQLMQWLWRQEYWLPPGITWEDMQETEDIHYPQPYHLLLCLPIMLLLVALRFFFKRMIAMLLSKKLGLQEKVRRKPSPDSILEAFYRKWRKSPPKEKVSGLAKHCDLQPRQVERWFRYQLNQNRPSLTKEFCETSLGATYYFTSFCTGLVILYDKPWFWDLRKYWVGYPKQPFQLSLFGYYIMQFSFNCFLIISLPFDDKQKDFYQQIVHHLVTIILIGLSYCLNYIRIGSLILLLTDFSHCLLLATKTFHYLKWQKTGDRLFVIFAAVFLFIHLVIFPSKILHSTYYECMEFYQPFFGYYFFNALLMVLQLLFIFWSYLIILMSYKFLIHGRVKKDVRRDSESSTDDDDDDEVGQKIEQKNSTIDHQPNCQVPCLTRRAVGVSPSVVSLKPGSQLSL
ncbi:ceramide synthase 4-like [Crotalus tigris]|uniref:ceramide synthase 4-like n=1 Tax=Crotalus tigris TaxID=88082 RepID=UPI00192FAA0F|nr:ceramide synthase 4-like [Crotalus tigris]